LLEQYNRLRYENNNSKDNNNDLLDLLRKKQDYEYANNQRKIGGVGSSKKGPVFKRKLHSRSFH
jgi:hypothetical protein